MFAKNSITREDHPGEVFEETAGAPAGAGPWIDFEYLQPPFPGHDQSDVNADPPPSMPAAMAPAISCRTLQGGLDLTLVGALEMARAGMPYLPKLESMGRP